MPARGQATLLIGTARFAGGCAAYFARLEAERQSPLEPRAPLEPPWAARAATAVRPEPAPGSLVIHSRERARVWERGERGRAGGEGERKREARERGVRVQRLRVRK